MLLALNEQKQREFESYYLGETVEVLMEEEMERDGKRLQTGHTKEYMKIAIESDKKLQNQLADVELTSPLQIIH